MAAVALLPFSPLAWFFHFEPPPAIFFGWLAGMLAAYLALAEVAPPTARPPHSLI